MGGNLTLHRCFSDVKCSVCRLSGFAPLPPFRAFGLSLFAERKETNRKREILSGDQAQAEYETQQNELAPQVTTMQRKVAPYG